MERKNIFCHFESDLTHDGEDDFIGEQVGEDEMDTESDSEEDSIQRMDLSASDEHSEDDEPSTTTLQPLDMAFLSREVEGGVSTGSDNRDMSPSSSPAPTSSVLPTSAHSDLPSDLHGYYKSKDGNVWCKNAPEPTKTPSWNIFRPPTRQVINPRNMHTAGAAYKKKIVNVKMIERIAKCSNKEGQRVGGEQWRHTDVNEIEGFFGCLLHMGSLRDNGTPTTILWSKTEGNPLVMACFSRDRFLKFSNHLRFDESNEESKKREGCLCTFTRLMGRLQRKLEQRICAWANSHRRQATHALERAMCIFTVHPIKAG